MLSRDLRPLGAALLVIAPLSLGVGECAPGSPARDAFGWLHRLVFQVAVLDERVSEVEACTCCCEGILEPVCTMGGVTYVNACEAHCAGVPLAHPGPCEPMPPHCGGFAGFVCPDPGQVCQFPPGTCDIIDNLGSCVVPPDACAFIFDPVCGCDGQTYGNACLALAQRAQIDHPGPCR